MAVHDVPPHYRGVWRRILLETPDARDTRTTVFWLQASRWHADIRIPHDRPDFSGIRSLGECRPAQLAWLATQQGFAGVTAVSADPAGVETCQWHRVADFQPPAATPDAGTMQFHGSRLIETGIHAQYVEAWRRLPASANGQMALQLQAHPASALRLLLVTGRHVMHVRSRRAAWPAGVTPGIALGELVAAGHFDLLDFEISIGQLNADGWTIRRSTLPWLENRSLSMRVRYMDGGRMEVDFDGDLQCWNVLEWTRPV